MVKASCKTSKIPQRSKSCRKAGITVVKFMAITHYHQIDHFSSKSKNQQQGQLLRRVRNNRIQIKYSNLSMGLRQWNGWPWQPSIPGIHKWSHRARHRPSRRTTRRWSRGATRIRTTRLSPIGTIVIKKESKETFARQTDLRLRRLIISPLSETVLWSKHWLSQIWTNSSNKIVIEPGP